MAVRIARQCRPKKSLRIARTWSINRIRVPPPCETSAAQCAFVDDFNYDGRVIEVKVKDEPSDEPLGMATPIPVIVLDDSLIANPGIGDGSFFPGDPPLLNVLYCVYLI